MAMAEILNPDVTYLRLESVRPAQNRRRYYIVILARTLWGSFGICCMWGRLDQAPRGLRVVEAEDRDGARLEMDKIVALRLRHGYSVK